MMNILYFDQHIAVAEKPAGILSQGDDKNNPNMPDLLQKELGGQIFPVHRLDRETSGVMVFARTKKAAATLSEYIASGHMEKEYFAVLCHAPEIPEGILEDLLFFDRQRGKVFPVKRERRGVKKAILHYRTLACSPEGCLVSVQPITGRTHQIRVQFASRKMPLLGDRKYGGEKGQLALFSHRISFSHPETGEKLTFSCLPEESLPWDRFSRFFSR